MLLNKNWESFEILTNTRTPDGRSGYASEWSVSGTFSGIAVLGQTMHDRARETGVTAAQHDISKPCYSLLTSRAVTLPFHAVVRRTRDGKCFQVTSGAFDAGTPNGAKLDLRMHAAEEYRLPDGASWKPVPPAETPTETPTGTEGEGNDQSGSDP